MLRNKCGLSFILSICMGWVWAIACLPLQAQTLSVCTLQLLGTGEYKVKSGGASVYTSNTLTNGVTTHLGDDCGQLTYSTSSKKYTWLMSRQAVVDYLIVGGGGSGGNVRGGGGGGGGVLNGKFKIAASTNYDFQVGASGANSTGIGLTAFAGGRGANGPSPAAGSDGASGGGGPGGAVGKRQLASFFSRGGRGTAGQGNDGASTNAQLLGLSGREVFVISGAGGGGAGGPGSSGRGSGADFGGEGGAGILSSITGSSIFYGAGGGGYRPTDYANNGGSWGAGGQGANAIRNGFAATTPGSGGGGGGNSTGPTDPALGGAGAKGIIVLKILGVSAPAGGNTYIGFGAGQNNNSGSNTFIGVSAGADDFLGFNNIEVGYFAGSTSSTTVKTNNNSIALGYRATFSSTSDVSNAISLGSGSVASSKTIQLGNSSLSKFQVGTVTAWPTPSDRALKTNIMDSTRGLSFVRQLKPMAYQFKGSEDPRTGFIAQEVEQADPQFPGLVKPEHEQDFYALQYDSFIPSLVKSVQELHGQVQAFQAPRAQASGWASLKWLGFLGALTLACLGACWYMHMKIRAWAALPERG